MTVTDYPLANNTSQWVSDGTQWRPVGGELLLGRFADKEAIGGAQALVALGRNIVIPAGMMSSVGDRIVISGTARKRYANGWLNLDFRFGTGNGFSDSFHGGFANFVQDIDGQLVDFRCEIYRSSATKVTSSIVLTRDTPSAHVEMPSTLSMGQTTVNLSVCKTFGLDVVVDGHHIPNAAGTDGWQQGASDAQVVLGKTYDGKQFEASQTFQTAPLRVRQSFGEQDTNIDFESDMYVNMGFNGAHPGDGVSFLAIEVRFFV